GGGRGVVGRAVALDSEYVPSGMLRVTHGEVNPVSRAADLDVHAVPAPDERIVHGLLEGAVEVGTGREAGSLCDGTGASLRVIQEDLQVTGAQGSGPAQIDLIGEQSREHDQLAPRAGNGDIQAALATLTVERTKVHRHSACCVRAVADGEEDDVSLVALDVLQVLDEQRFHRGLAGPGQVLVRPS